MEEDDGEERRGWNERESRGGGARLVLGFGTTCLSRRNISQVKSSITPLSSFLQVLQRLHADPKAALYTKNVMRMPKIGKFKKKLTLTYMVRWVAGYTFSVLCKPSQVAHSAGG